MVHTWASKTWRVQARLLVLVAFASLIHSFNHRRRWTSFQQVLTGFHLLRVVSPNATMSSRVTVVQSLHLSSIFVGGTVRGKRISLHRRSSGFLPSSKAFLHASADDIWTSGTLERHPHTRERKARTYEIEKGNAAMPGKREEAMALSILACRQDTDVVQDSKGIFSLCALISVCICNTATAPRAWIWLANTHPENREESADRHSCWSDLVSLAEYQNQPDTIRSVSPDHPSPPIHHSTTAPPLITK